MLLDEWYKSVSKGCEAEKREYAREVSAWFRDLKSRRIVVEVRDDLDREIMIIGVAERLGDILVDERAMQSL